MVEGAGLARRLNKNRDDIKTGAVDTRSRPAAPTHALEALIAERSSPAVKAAPASLLDGTLRFIEVKGRAAGARDLILTQNEVRASLNAPERWWLAVVEVDNGFARTAAYLKDLGLREPSFAETAVVLNLDRLRQASL